ncbi:hypothetical protein [Pseudobacteriovorax antillogorgiicola]|uniref:Uncharacterized protein n=1 Tax=Pseudobacteriovorax antillogorgiicola TaxID=1513793 RepID=A0A1Y6BSL5_9BACT|nr:hypothetical protein [Pseudobacteriovorax antillogorgiicola]TCS53704.1 hypothetical protein EDD56_10713 [Pseudobacteriovorax antillogorgiicola]SMF22991.1 hypothetical protein SAMN06296036_107259 [Pseudobacteriovorax antillogorgiicola]
MDKAIILIGLLLALNIILGSCLIGKNMETDSLEANLEESYREISQLEQQRLWEKGFDSKYGIKPGCDGQGNCK